MGTSFRNGHQLPQTVKHTRCLPSINRWAYLVLLLLLLRRTAGYLPAGARHHHLLLLLLPINLPRLLWQQLWLGRLRHCCLLLLALQMLLLLPLALGSGFLFGRDGLREGRQLILLAHRCCWHNGRR